LQVSLDTPRAEDCGTDYFGQVAVDDMQRLVIEVTLPNLQLHKTSRGHSQNVNYHNDSEHAAANISVPHHSSLDIFNEQEQKCALFWKTYIPHVFFIFTLLFVLLFIITKTVFYC
jgi:hypothetical protein